MHTLSKFVYICWCIVTYYFIERVGICNPSLYFSFGNTSRSIVYDESSRFQNDGSIVDSVFVKENLQCGRGAEFSNGHIKIDGEKFKGNYFREKKFLFNQKEFKV